MENETKDSLAKRPTHAAWWVKEREGKKDEWRKIGVAWNHGDGKGISVSLDLQPIDGRVVLRLIEDRREEDKRD